jgi:hypothetical protein
MWTVRTIGSGSAGAAGTWAVPHNQQPSPSAAACIATEMSSEKWKGFFIG